MRIFILITSTRDEEMFFLLGCLFFSLIWGMLHGAHGVHEPRSVDLPRLCLSNCICGRFTAECMLTFCEQEYETTSEILILRGGMCHAQWDRLKHLPYATKVELHNARCPQMLDFCE